MYYKSQINTPDIPIVEALYNHYKKYTMEEIIKYIEYLENKKGILSPSVIEYLLQLNSGDYTKLKKTYCMIMTLTLHLNYMRKFLQ